MDYNELVHKLTHKKVIVSGAQRSGTTFTAKALAADLNVPYIDENHFHNVGFDFEKLVKLIVTYDAFVVHCPPLSSLLHNLRFFKDFAIVFLRRDVNEIIKSQERIRWRCEKEEKNKLYSALVRDFPGFQFDFSLPISVLKYHFWEKQKHLLDVYQCKYFELEYNSMKTHHMFKESRVHFAPKQTS